MRYLIDIPEWSAKSEQILKPVTFFTLFFFLPFLLYGQQRQELENRRKQLIQEIKVTSNLLNTTKKNREATLDRYLTLQKQIQKRGLLIRTLREEIDFTTTSIDRSISVVEALNDDVARLREEYTQMVRAAYRQKLTNSALFFIFSADSFNQAFQRWQYLKQYDAYRQKQANLILETQNTLSSKVEQLEKRKREKQRLLDSEERQTYLLEKELGIKNELLLNLKSDETRLVKDLESKEQAHRRLDGVIEKIIRTEMEKRRRAERESVVTVPKSSPNASAKAPNLSSTTNLTGAFQRQKGRLPWPVKNGIITGSFGKQKYGSLANVEIINNGIDIQTDKNAEVRAVFDGKVAGIQFIPGYAYAIIVKHGNYYTVYSNLEKVVVKEQDEVKTRQTIGTVRTDNRTNTSEVHFEIWQDKNRLNPSSWVSKR